MTHEFEDELAEARAEHFALFQELLDQHRQRLADRLPDPWPATPLKEISREEEAALSKEIADALREPPDLDLMREGIATLRAMLAERG